MHNLQKRLIGRQFNKESKILKWIPSVNYFLNLNPNINMIFR